MADSLALSGIGYGSVYDNQNSLFSSVFDGGYGSSVFGPNAMSVYGAQPGLYGSYGMGMGMMPGFGAGVMPSDYQRLARMNPAERQAYIADIEDQQYEFTNRRSELMEDRQIERQLKRAQRTNTINEGERAAKIAAQRLSIIIQQNRKDEVLAAFAELKSQIAKMPQNKKLIKGADGRYTAIELEDKELTAKALEYYAQTTGVNLNAQIDSELAHSYWQGLKRALSFGAADREDADTLNEKILGLDRDSSNRTARFAGNVTGAGLFGISGLTMIGLLKTLKKAKP